MLLFDKMNSVATMKRLINPLCMTVSLCRHALSERNVLETTYFLYYQGLINVNKQFKDHL